MYEYFSGAPIFVLQCEASNIEPKPKGWFLNPHQGIVIEQSVGSITRCIHPITPAPSSPDRSQLSHVVQDLDLLTGLECRETEVRTARTTESITKRTTTTRAGLPLHGKVQLVEVVRVQLHHIQTLIRVCTTLLILGLESLGKTACTIFAGSPPPAGLRLALWS